MVQAPDYSGSLPGPEDVLLLIEVSDTTPRYNREVKLSLYAGFGIEEIRIADLTGEAIERNNGRSGDSYRRTEKA